LLDTQRGNDARTILLDFGYTPEALITNMELQGVDPRKINALILSHGHNDHWGGLIGFLDKKRDLLPVDLTLYCGGEDNFCKRYAGTSPGPFSDRGVLDRNAIAAHQVKLVLAQSPTVIEKQAFTTGQIKRSGIEKILPNTMVEFAVKDGLGCEMSHFTSAELQGKIMPDQHVHEHATCFNVKDRGLIVSAYKVQYAKVPTADGSDYTVDHSGYIYLMDRAGQYLGFFPPGTSPDRMTDVIRPLVDRAHLP
jgi:7,8-dihydropterin-6-yl-methyl-4-(beta-D-ribofuranosyl)aminobenzene 5'-phosphate synthase